MGSRFEITERDLPKEKRNERVTIEMSRYDLEIILHRGRIILKRVIQA